MGGGKGRLPYSGLLPHRSWAGPEQTPTSLSSRRPVAQGRKPRLPDEESRLGVLIRAPPDAESEPRSWVQKFI